jgi:hypothetical protein
MDGLLSFLEGYSEVEVPADATSIVLVRKTGKSRGIVRQSGERVYDAKGGSFQALLKECVEWKGEGAVPVVETDDGFVEYALVSGSWRKVVESRARRVVYIGA